ncbi:hypothetical protein [Streptomyces phaeoluteigriseus]|uniref:hypothetical protein n=1 Tax=Streptomyces phaeoluteigriseus TaxID=114686 RepID=UPI000B8D0D1F|nr:hypothetical protein [Streptomyces phaeoluteigriseus]
MTSEHPLSGGADTTGTHAVLRRWPTALGLAAVAAQFATGVERESLSVVVCVACLCYLATAASGRPQVAWPAIVGGSLVVVAAEPAGLPWWSGIAGTALILVVLGLVTRVPRAALTAQTVAMAGYGAVALGALALAPRLGLALAGLGLAAHGLWDVVHYRRDAVVPRSLSEFCLVLDVPLGLGALALAVLS